MALIEEYERLRVPALPPPPLLPGTGQREGSGFGIANLHFIARPVHTTGVEIVHGSKVQCLFCFEFCTAEGRGGEKGGNANFKTKHTEPLTQ